MMPPPTITTRACVVTVSLVALRGGKVLVECLPTDDLASTGSGNVLPL